LLDVIAFIVFGILFLAIVVAIVALGSLPGNIARRRGHPQVDAIAVAGWLGIASLGVLWPIAFIWAFLRPDDGAGEVPPETDEAQQLADLQSRMTAVESTVDNLQTTSKSGSS
jgi:hypothetical protein